jgi:hypothetical protein
VWFGEDSGRSVWAWEFGAFVQWGSTEDCTVVTPEGVDVGVKENGEYMSQEGETRIG